MSITDGVSPFISDGAIPDMFPVSRIYGPIIKQLKKLSSYQTKVFGYDWRFGIDETAIKLSEYVNSLRKKGFSEFNFVTHSMGGCILAYYLRYCSDAQWSNCKDVKSVVFCVSPFSGTARAVKYALIGNSFLLNKKILGSETTCTFPVTYQVMPFYKNALCTVSNEKEIDLFDSDNWKKYSLGLYTSKKYQEDTISSFMEKSLAKTKEIYCNMNNTSGPKAPDTLRVLNLLFGIFCYSSYAVHVNTIILL